MGTSKYHGMEDVRLDMCILHTKSPIRTLFSLYGTLRNQKFVHTNTSPGFYYSKISSGIAKLTSANDTNSK